MRAAHDAYRAGRAVAVGENRLKTVRRATEAGRYDARAHQNLVEALAAVEHGCMSSWRATPYGVVWIDNEV
ncbi:hypothetical protein EES39_38405 [Streptomyces sp. ADI92-24]|uniref:hypothetical protein n=1 Tax=Streptomyces sp. ADI92-24 TaxID=1522756 RepID=UPI000F554439|nr:hypothetical protein [Streptomyces sp. ADI92-24]RPK32538.1 hypothetical protein EES39_38405 [Streptomyces sp. ADI92-24]